MVAKTGRRMQTSASLCMRSSLLLRLDGFPVVKIAQAIDGDNRVRSDAGENPDGAAVGFSKLHHGDVRFSVAENENLGGVGARIGEHGFARNENSLLAAGQQDARR